MGYGTRSQQHAQPPYCAHSPYLPYSTPYYRIHPFTISTNLLCGGADARANIVQLRTADDGPRTLVYRVESREIENLGMSQKYK